MPQFLYCQGAEITRPSAKVIDCIRVVDNMLRMPANLSKRLPAVAVSATWAALSAASLSLVLNSLSLPRSAKKRSNKPTAPGARKNLPIYIAVSLPKTSHKEMAKVATGKQAIAIYPLQRGPAAATAKL